MNLEYFMSLALAQAGQAFDRGEFPVGCVIVQDGEVLAEGCRKGTVSGHGAVSEVDHAEIRALKNLEQAGICFDPEKTALFCTMEPCLMCYGAIILSGIKKIVYAYEDVMGGGTGCDIQTMPPLYRDSRMVVTGGVCRQKSLDLFLILCYN